MDFEEHNQLATKAVKDIVNYINEQELTLPITLDALLNVITKVLLTYGVNENTMDDALKEVSSNLRKIIEEYLEIKRS